VDHAGVKQHALGDRGLAGVNVRSDPDVARPLQRKLCDPANSDFAGAFFCSIVAVAIKLPAEMRKRSIRLRHLVSVLAFLDRVALTCSGVFDFLRQRIGHALAAATVRVLHDPAHGQRNLSCRRNFHRHLIGGTTNTT
jgi:hypothetical protein